MLDRMTFKGSINPDSVIPKERNLLFLPILFYLSLQGVLKQVYRYIDKQTNKFSEIKLKKIIRNLILITSSLIQS